ncbi:hypothetical protein [Streptomyces sp. XD-27]|uniref:hypothetical protein n=1 Tax=Streptomyces sp. XD-27 TaxID=3062779 RepID=UPI0026F40EDE|nr:hypothetical protein [Streptomyces sp. XD-27]WKX72113.1 hypothetical protein Q3Y56_21385 [Streptomyces sp. XD-27]
MAAISDGIYRIQFTNEQLLTSLDGSPGGPLVLLSPGEGSTQDWIVENRGNGRCSIKDRDSNLYVSFEGEPDMHELAILLPEPRAWNLIPDKGRNSFIIGVEGAPMRLGMSLLKIFPPRVALAPEYGPQYQAWTFELVEELVS